MKRMIIDPPEGWRYGFPKPIPKVLLDGNDEATDKAFVEWLFGEGYPFDMMELALKYSRYWEEEDD